MNEYTVIVNEDITVQKVKAENFMEAQINALQKIADIIYRTNDGKTNLMTTEQTK